MMSDGYEILRTAILIADQSRMYVKVKRKRLRKQAMKIVPAATLIGGIIDGAAGCVVGN